MINRLCMVLCAVAAAQAQAQTDLAAFGIAPGAEPMTGVFAPPSYTGAERIYWNNRPIPITLQVGLERQIRFPAGVRVGIDPAINDHLRTQSVDGTVHWLAHAPFETTRIQVRESRSGRTYLLDLRAVAEGGDVNSLEIVDFERLEETQTGYYMDGGPSETSDRGAGSTPETEGQAAGLDAALDEGAPNYDLVRLARFAFQQLYAPERLLTRLELPGLIRVPVSSRALYLYRGGALKTTPYVSWTDGLHTVTAVKLENLTGQTVLVDPRDFRGRWVARGVLTAELLARGDPHGRDQGLAVLISPLPFAASLP